MKSTHIRHIRTRARPAASFYMKPIICGVDRRVLARRVRVNTTVGSRVALNGQPYEPRKDVPLHRTTKIRNGQSQCYSIAQPRTGDRRGPGLAISNLNFDLKFRFQPPPNDSISYTAFSLTRKSSRS